MWVRKPTHPGAWWGKAIGRKISPFPYEVVDLGGLFILNEMYQISVDDLEFDGWMWYEAIMPEEPKVQF